MATKTVAAKKTSHSARSAKKGPHKEKKTAAQKKLDAAVKESKRRGTVAKKKPATKTASAKKLIEKHAKPKKAKKRANLDMKPIKTKVGKMELFNMIAAATELDRKTVRSIFEQLADIAKASMMPRGAGQFQIPGVVTLKTRKVKARKIEAIKAGTMVRNPRTGEETPHPGRKSGVKPATVKVRAVATGSLKRAALGTE